MCESTVTGKNCGSTSIHLGCAIAPDGGIYLAAMSVDEYFWGAPAGEPITTPATGHAPAERADRVCRRSRPMRHREVQPSVPGRLAGHVRSALAGCRGERREHRVVADRPWLVRRVHQDRGVRLRLARGRGSDCARNLCGLRWEFEVPRSNRSAAFERLSPRFHRAGRVRRALRRREDSRRAAGAGLVPARRGAAQSGLTRATCRARQLTGTLPTGAVHPAGTGNCVV